MWKEGEDKSLRKRHGLQGPIDDAFLDSFLCVRPTGRAANDVAGRYAEETDYQRELTPPLTAEEAAWIKEHISNGRSEKRSSSTIPSRKRRS